MVMVVTGSSKGIGLALTQHYLLQGYWVAGISRTETPINHARFLPVLADLNNSGELKEAWRDIRLWKKRVDILLNNAGIAKLNPMISTPTETAAQVFQTNVIAAFQCMNEAAKIMIKQGYGRMVNFTSVSRPLYLESQSVYAASKSALETLTLISSKEWGKMGITVNAIGPNPIETDLIKSIRPEWIKKIIENQAIPRTGSMHDVIHVVNFFISPEASLISGQIIYLGGAH